MWKLIIIYLLAINLISYIYYGVDKKKAQRGLWRIPEKKLFFLAIIGGSVGSIAGMLHFRHKTKHKTFTVGIPYILILQICIVAYIIYILY